MELSSDRQADEMSRLTSISLPRVKQVTGLIVTEAMKVHSSSGLACSRVLRKLARLTSQEKKGRKALDRLAFQSFTMKRQLSSATATTSSFKT